MAYERKTVDIFVSDEMRSLLSEIEHDSLVAHLLLRKRHSKEELVDDCVNYISISQSDSTKISYLTPERIEKIDEQEYWTSSRRFQAKPGSFVSKIFKNISSKEVEKFSNLYKTFTKKSKFTLRVVSGQEIKKFYHYDSYKSGSGTLGASCMKHDSSQKLLDVYSENPDKVSMLVMTDECDMLMGRAILWDFNSYKLMDRIYTICDEDFSFWFKKWATENGYLYKSEQNWYNTLQFEKIGDKKQELRVKISLDSADHRYYPYMDTFKFIDEEFNLYNYQPEGVRFYTLCSTDGCRQNSDYLRFDGVSKVYRYSHESCYIEYLNIYTTSSNCIYSESNDCYILHKDSIYDEEARDYIFGEEYASLNNMESIEYRRKRYSERPKRKKLDSFINEVITRENVLNDNIINEIYNRISGISSGYFDLTPTTQMGINPQEETQVESAE